MEKEFGQIPSNMMRIVLYGPESTGKTTLAKQLAEYYNTQWVPEYMRSFLEKKTILPEEEIVSYEELSLIAKGQMQTENALVEKAKDFLFCDTNLLELQVYAEHYFDKCPELISEYAEKNTYALYILTYIDTPWVADGLRDRPNNREYMFSKFEKKLQEKNLEYIIVKGNEKERLDFVVSHLNKTFKPVLS